MPFAALGVAHLRGERAQLRQRLHAEIAEPAEECVQHVDGGPRIGQGPVDRLGAGLEVGREGGQLAVRYLVAGQHPAGQERGVDHRIARPPQPAGLAGQAEKAHVERGVVRDQDAAGGELEEGRQHRRDRRRVADHRVRDAGEHTHERSDPNARVDQRLKLADDLARREP